MYQSACFVSFEHGGDASLLLSTLGTFLGVNDGIYNPKSPDAALAQLQSALSTRPTLLIADNLESLLSTGDAPLKRAARSELWHILRELATLAAGILLISRDPLVGEDQLAPGAHLATRLLEDLGIDRARAPYADLRDLLLHLDHHPLAIQLVLPTLRERALDAIRTEFVTLLPSFTDDHTRGRNRSLLASLDYSLRRLTDTQRAWLPRLALFEGGADEDSLLSITEIPEAEWSDLRLALEQAALLTPEPIVGCPILFFRFHPVLTPYLRSQPGAATADPALRERFARRYVAVAIDLHHHDHQHPQAVRALVSKEVPNLCRALALLLESGDQEQLEEATNLVDRLAFFLTTLGRWCERDALRQQVTATLARGLATEAGEAAPLSATPGALTQAEYLHEGGLGVDELGRGNLRAATVRFRQLLSRIEALPAGVPRGTGSYQHSLILAQLALCLRDSGQLTVAENHLRQALAIMDALFQQQPENPDYLDQRSGMLTDLATVLRRQGRYSQAREVYLQALKIYQRLNHLPGQATIEGQLGKLALEQRDYSEAQARHLAALSISQDLDNPAMEAVAWHQLGKLALEQEQGPEAERCYRESLALRERLGDAALAAQTCNDLAIVAERTGRPGEAEDWYHRAMEYGEQANPGSPKALYLSNLAALLVSQVQAGQAETTRLAEAKHLVELSLAIRETREVSEDTQIWTIFNLLARIANLEGRAEETCTYRRREREAYAAFAGNRYHLERQLGWLIADIAAAAQNDDEARQQQIEAVLPELEAKGWHITAATHRIWAGERNWQALVEEMDNQDALLILCVLETIASPEAVSLQQVSKVILASLPRLVFEALRQGDPAAFNQAMTALSSEEQQRVMAALQTLPDLEEKGESEHGE